MTTDSAATVGDAVIRRYSALARTALAGDAIADCDPEAFDNGHSAQPPIQMPTPQTQHSMPAWGAATR